MEETIDKPKATKKMIIWILLGVMLLLTILNLVTIGMDAFLLTNKGKEINNELSSNMSNIKMWETVVGKEWKVGSSEPTSYLFSCIWPVFALILMINIVGNLVFFFKKPNNKFLISITISFIAILVMFALFNHCIIFESNFVTRFEGKYSSYKLKIIDDIYRRGPALTFGIVVNLIGMLIGMATIYVNKRSWGK